MGNNVSLINGHIDECDINCTEKDNVKTIENCNRQIERLQTLLCNAIEYISEITGEEDLKWCENTIGITVSEAEELRDRYLKDM